jgi:hypothetical protein
MKNRSNQRTKIGLNGKPMSSNVGNSVQPKLDHIGGNFEWEIEPSCTCGNIKQAVQDRFIFVSNLVEEDGLNKLYFIPVSAGGSITVSDGMTFDYCPWCGDRIAARKKYKSD